MDTVFSAGTMKSNLFPTATDQKESVVPLMSFCCVTDCAPFLDRLLHVSMQGVCGGGSPPPKVLWLLFGVGTVHLGLPWFLWNEMAQCRCIADTRQCAALLQPLPLRCCRCCRT